MLKIGQPLAQSTLTSPNLAASDRISQIQFENPISLVESGSLSGKPPVLAPKAAFLLHLTCNASLMSHGPWQLVNLMTVSDEYKLNSIAENRAIMEKAAATKNLASCFVMNIKLNYKELHAVIIFT